MRLADIAWWLLAVCTRARAALVLAVALGACQFDASPQPPAGSRFPDAGSRPDGGVQPPMDGGGGSGGAGGRPPRPPGSEDGGIKLPPQAGADAGSDAGTDAGFDAGTDAGLDAGLDAGADAGVDAGTDAGVDAGQAGTGGAGAGGAGSGGMAGGAGSGGMAGGAGSGGMAGGAGSGGMAGAGGMAGGAGSGGCSACPPGEACNADGMCDPVQGQCEEMVATCLTAYTGSATELCFALSDELACLGAILNAYGISGCGSCSALPLPALQSVCQDGATCSATLSYATGSSLITDECTSCFAPIVPTTCAEAHGYVGCCTDGDAYWYEGGMLYGSPGSCMGLGCGWDAAGGYYNCGKSGADPSGTYPIDCGGVNPSPETCPACGCASRACGDDGCGTSCGSCSPGDKCSPTGQCVPDATTICKQKGGCTALDTCDCTTCVTNGQCTVADDCVCPDCVADLFCTDPANCDDDGLCDTFNEGCACADCQNHPLCP